MIKNSSEIPILQVTARDSRRFDADCCKYVGPEEYEEPVRREAKRLLARFFLERDAQLQSRLNRDDRKRAASEEHEERFTIYDARSERFGNVFGAVSGQVALERGKMEEPLPVQLEVHILSRFDEDRNYFLSMLLFGRDFRTIDESILTGQGDATLDAMLFLKFQKHMRVIERKGYYRQYRSRQKNDMRPRGTIDLAEHLRRNVGLDGGSIASRYRELSAGNPLNRLIVRTYEVMRRKYPLLVESSAAASPGVRAAVQELRSRFTAGQEDLRALLEANRDPITHPFYQDFEQLRQTCIQILRKEADAMFGKKEEGEGVTGALFYAPDYWEMFLERSFMGLRGFKVKPQAEEYLFGPDFKQMGLPDFLFFEERGGAPVAVLDAKYKQGWNDAARTGKLGSGIFGLLADFDKCIRDMVAENVQMTGVIYPVAEKDLYRGDECHVITRENGAALFYTFAVPVPRVKARESYEQWRGRFDCGLIKAIKQVQEALDREAAFLQDGRPMLQALAELRSRLDGRD